MKIVAGTKTRPYSWEKRKKMLAVVVMGAVALSLFIEIIVFFLSPEEL